jgi:hypothetical protein
MKKLLLALLLLASPALAGGIVDNGDGTSTLTSSAPNVFIMGICGLVQGWAPPTTLTCDGTYKGQTWVELGVCTQGEADTSDLLPTQECTQALVNQGICLDGWQNDPKVVIPQASKCGPVAFLWVRSGGKSYSQNGIKRLEEQRKQAPGDDSGEWN